MVVRVTVVDATAAAGLMGRLTREVELETVSFDPLRQQVLLEVEKNPDQALGRILNLVQQWLGADGRTPTDVEIDERRYVLGA